MDDFQNTLYKHELAQQVYNSDRNNLSLDTVRCCPNDIKSLTVR